MQGQPLVQQCWDNQQDAQSCSPAAEAQSLFCWTTHIWTLYRKVIQPLYVCCMTGHVLLVSDSLQPFCQFLHLQPFTCYITYYCLLVFFLFSHKDISRFVRVTPPPLPLISLGVTLRFGLSWQRKTQARLYSICEVSVVASILHICCWDREGPCTTIPHPHLVRNMQAWMSSQKYKWDINLFLWSIQKILDLHGCKRYFRTVLRSTMLPLQT